MSRGRFERDFLDEYSDEALLAEIRRVAKMATNDTVTAKEFERLSGRVSASTVRHRFKGWKNALDAAGLGDLYTGRSVTSKSRLQHGRGKSDEYLLDEMRRIHSLGKGEYLTMPIFNENSQMSAATAQRRFGTWAAALEAAGLAQSRLTNKRWTHEECFENLAAVWEHFGRRPSYDAMNSKPSLIPTSAYVTRWGTWRRALKEFVRWAETGSPVRTEPSKPRSEAGAPTPKQGRPRVGARVISARMRFRVFQRDNFRCRACGGSPAMEAGVVLHLDHVIPIALGGDSRVENLQVLCQSCNLGKSASSVPELTMSRSGDYHEDIENVYA